MHLLALLVGWLNQCDSFWSSLNHINSYRLFCITSTTNYFKLHHFGPLGCVPENGRLWLNPYARFCSSLDLQQHCAVPYKQKRHGGVGSQKKNNGLKMCLLRRMVGNGGETPQVACLPMTTAFVGRLCGQQQLTHYASLQRLQRNIVKLATETIILCKHIAKNRTICCCNGLM